eukprot:365029-Chlamydomonas_euryale.AAC.2
MAPWLAARDGRAAAPRSLGPASRLHGIRTPAQQAQRRPQRGGYVRPAGIAEPQHQNGHADDGPVHGSSGGGGGGGSGGGPQGGCVAGPEEHGLGGTPEATTVQQELREMKQQVGRLCLGATQQAGVELAFAHTFAHTNEAPVCDAAGGS